MVLSLARESSLQAWKRVYSMTGPTLRIHWNFQLEKKKQRTFTKASNVVFSAISASCPRPWETIQVGIVASLPSFTESLPSGQGRLVMETMFLDFPFEEWI